MTRGVDISTLHRAWRGETAILAVVVYDLVAAEAVIAAAEAEASPLILQIGSPAFRHVDPMSLVAGALRLAEASSTQVGIHLDHSTDLEEIRRSLDAGYTSVMADGSRLSDDENASLTAEVVGLARPYGVWVEAELGRMDGDENRSDHGSGDEQLTDPAAARRFVDATGVDALAICIGNIHGFSASAPKLDLERLDRIRSNVDVPLVLHGASGVSPAVLRQCIRRGVAKVNVNTELREAYVTGFHEPNAPPDDLVTRIDSARRSVRDRTRELMRSLDGVEPR